MERVEVVAGHTFVMRTRQLGPSVWCCDVFERAALGEIELFLYENFGESELEAYAMAISEVGH